MKFLLVLAGILAVPMFAHAAGPGGDVYLGYSRLGANEFYSNLPGLNGWEAAGHLKLAPFVGAELDASHYGMGASAVVPRSTVVLFGPRVTVGAAGVHVFAHGLGGVEHSTNNGTQPTPISGTAVAWALGGGVDFRLAPFFAWRVNGDYIAAPNQAGQNANHVRFGTGLVFRF